jgi:hypothetical protein
MSANGDLKIFSSHDAYSGSYAVFQGFRLAVVAAFGEKYNMDYFYPEGHPGLSALLSQNSSAKWIEPEVCIRIADELEALLPWLDGKSTGLDSRTPGEIARQFIAGCRRAAAVNEPLTFEDNSMNVFGLWHRGW